MTHVCLTLIPPSNLFFPLFLLPPNCFISQSSRVKITNLKCKRAFNINLSVTFIFPYPLPLLVFTSSLTPGCPILHLTFLLPSSFVNFPTSLCLSGNTSLG